MLPNGHYHIVDRAVRVAGDPLLARWRKALILGTFREDKGNLFGRVVPTFSFTHFAGAWLPGGYFPLVMPGAASTAEKFFRRAVEAQRTGRTAEGMIALGRACHLLVDMACPTHAQRQAHATDPYEWWVEGNIAELEALPLPEAPEAGSAEALVNGLARVAQGLRADKTHTVPGWLGAKLGVWKPVLPAEAREQARVLVPLSVAHTVALFRLFARQTAGVRAAAVPA